MKDNVKEVKDKKQAQGSDRNCSTYLSPIGKIYLVCTDKGLSGVWFEKPTDFSESAFSESASLSPLMKNVKKQLHEYFQGNRRKWDIPLDWGEKDNFYSSVRKNCAKVGYGETISYGELAKKSNSPRAARAVGTAMATNPISIVVPCHRVVPATGKIGKYGGGTAKKEWLQKFEAGAHE